MNHFGGKNIKSIKINTILNIFNTILQMSFSVITYPYAARVLQVSNFGKVNYTNSIVNYFVLLAGLGMGTYAIREGSRYKKKTEELNMFASQIFSLNCLTAITSYILLIITFLFVTNFRNYWLLFLIQGVAIFNVWIGSNWLNIVFEDYIFITIRSIVVQLLSIILLFLFVNTPEDYYIYATISVFSNFIVGIINLVYVRRYCKFRFTKKIDIKKHIRPILVFFSNNLAITIYVNSDITMLGWLLGDYSVGLYSVAVKIYTAIRTIIAAVYNVSIARLSEYMARNNMINYKDLLNKIINTVILISLPATFGLVLAAEDIIILMSGQDYIFSKTSLTILAFALFFAVMGGILAYCIDVPLKQEKKVLFATIISAFENIGINFFFIPRYGIEGAAITTLISEITVFLLLIVGLKQYLVLFNIELIWNNIKKCIIAIIPAYGIGLFTYNICEGSVISRIFLTVCSLVICYVVINILLRNNCLYSLLKLHA